MVVISNITKYDKNFFAQITNYSKWPVDPFRNPPHHHDEYELYFLFYGSVNYIIDNDTYDVDSGNVVWIPPYTDHKTLPFKSERHKRLLFWISSEWLNDCLKDHKELAEFYSKHRIIKMSQKNITLFRKISNLLLQEYYSKRKKLHSDDAIKGILTAILVHLKQSSQVIEGQTSLSNSANYVPDKLMAYVNTHFTEDISLTTLAEQVNMNPIYVSSLFKKNFGITFKDYRLKLRIDKAKQLLKDTNLTVEAIAADCGFHSNNLFCKTFKREVGMSPLSFRNNDNE